MAAFKILLDLFAGIQPIKRKYPMVVAHYKHLQKISNNEHAQNVEIAKFKDWLEKNPNISERQLSDPFYHGSNQANVIYFLNVIIMATPETVDWFWKRLEMLESLLFPNGRIQKENEICSSSNCGDEEPISAGAAAAMSVLEANPIFSDMIDNVKSTVSDLNPNDLGSIIESKEFNKLVKNIQTGLKTGKYKMSDLTGTINAVIGSVQNELDPEMKTVVNSAASMMAAAERGEQPDVGKLLNMMKQVNFK